MRNIRFRLFRRLSISHAPHILTDDVLQPTGRSRFATVRAPVILGFDSQRFKLLQFEKALFDLAFLVSLFDVGTLCPGMYLLHAVYSQMVSCEFTAYV